MSGSIKTTDKSAPPRLERISLQINKHGTISSCHLPAFRDRLRDPRRRSLCCGNALVGHGNVTSRVALPSRELFLQGSRRP